MGTDLLAALGRMPNTEDLNVAAAGIDLDGRGFVKVNERLETTASDVWALGDVNGGPQFTHASLDDYRIVAANLSGGSRSTVDRVVPYTLFIDPELGRVGMTETEARSQGRRVRVFWWRERPKLRAKPPQVWVMRKTATGHQNMRSDLDLPCGCAYTFMIKIRLLASASQPSAPKRKNK